MSINHFKHRKYLSTAGGDAAKTSWRLRLPLLIAFCMTILPCANMAQAQDGSAPVLRGIPGNGNQDSDNTTRGDATDRGLAPVDDLSGGDSLNAESFELSKPALKALITIDRRVDPFALDATGSRAIKLTEVIDTALASNLDIGIAGFNERSLKANLLGSYGKFLPDINLAYQYNYLKGKANVPFGQTVEPLRFNNPLIITSAGFKYFGYRGGKVLFGALQNRNDYRASRAQKKATISDALREAVQLYYDLVLQEAILRIRIKAVETSQSQLTLDRDLKQGGLATNLEVLQAETQLSQDRQNLIDQQVARREAAIKLAENLNLPQDVDLVPDQLVVEKVRIVSPDALGTKLVSLAIDNRPELKQYEELRLAAKKQIMINAARLQPTFAFTGNVLGIGETLSKDTEMSPITLAGAGGSVVQVPRQRQITALYTLGFNFKWDFEGLGTVDAANIYSAKLKARQAGLEQQKVLNQVVSEVRRSYLKAMQTDRKIEEAISQVRSSNEELRLAQLRFQNGVGKNIDVLKAQQDYTSSLIEKARAIVNFNTAQVDLLRNIGLISTATLNSRVPVGN
ncbi:MAG: TolC family protein [Candidatus Obscuribacter sp.]|nr:TolC family protein [Candidatus Obscuribacter sp.]